METTLTTILAMPQTGLRLGRHIEHDDRSRAFSVSPPAKAAKLKTVLWPHTAPVLNQGQVGSCTGNAMAQLINTDAWKIPRAKIKGKGQWMSEQDAVRLYSQATALDDVEGTYPPTDTGSSGLAVSKAAKNAGYCSSYRHAFGLNAMLAALQLHPVIVGTTWTNQMFNPNRQGFVKPAGAPVGGHEYLCLGCDVDKEFLTFLNSWGSGWGYTGRFYISFDDFNTLLQDQGDVTVPIPVAK